MHLFYVFRLIACVVSVHTFLNQSALSRWCGQNQCSPSSLPMKFPWYPNEPGSSWKPRSIFQFVLGVKSNKWPRTDIPSIGRFYCRHHNLTGVLDSTSTQVNLHCILFGFSNFHIRSYEHFFFKVAVCWLPPELTPRKKKCRTVSVWVKKQAI